MWDKDKIVGSERGSQGTERESVLGRCVRGGSQ